MCMLQVLVTGFVRLGNERTQASLRNIEKLEREGPTVKVSDGGAKDTI